VKTAHADFLGVFSARVGIIAAEDRHIAAAAGGLFQKAPRRGAHLERRHHFEQDRVDRQQRIFQAVFGDVTVAVADVQAHDAGDIGDHGLETRRHQHVLERRLGLSLPRHHLDTTRREQPREPSRRDQDEDHHHQVGDDRQQDALAPRDRAADRTDVRMVIL